jgi:acyl-coenzyme A synthetase/AMP-(fatty) acid ligase
MYTAPTFYAALLAYPEADFKYDLSSLRFCVSAGSRCRSRLFDAWKKRFGIEILDGIGSTEMLTSSSATAGKGARLERVAPSCRATRRRSSTTMASARRGRDRNLWVSAIRAVPSTGTSTRKSKATFRGEWTVTGDKYHLDADGYYTYEGRGDDMLKVSGQWVSPAEVEAALMEHEAGARVRCGRREGTRTSSPSRGHSCS